MRNAKRNLVICIISFIFISSILVFSTFERRQSGFSVLGRSFFGGSNSGTFDLELYWTTDPNNGWNNVETTGNEIPFGNDVLWEPDKSVTRYFKIKNAGDYDFQYNLGINIPDPDYTTTAYIEEHPIGDVIDVYVCHDISNLSSKEYIGTLSECFQWPNILNKTNGNDLELDSNDSTTCALIFEMKHSAGNEYQGVYVNNDRTNNIGFKICAGASAEEPEQEYSGDFGVKLSNNDDFLYRVGNSNAVAASKLFYINESSSPSKSSLFAFSASAVDFDKSLVSFTSDRISGTSNVGFTFTSGSGTTPETYLSSSSFTFKGNGVIKVSMLYNGQVKSELYLEVVDGRNVTAGSTSFGSSNVVLIENISITSSCNLPNGKTLYGNGFTVTSSRSDTSGTSGFLNITNGTVDNVILLGEKYNDAVMSGTSNQYYAPGVFINGNANIYNSYISECKYAVSIGGGNVVIKNTTITGGALANVYISGGNVTLENCTTATSEIGGLKGMAIRVASLSCSLKLEGTFTQYNWLSTTDIDNTKLPSTYKTVLKQFYSDSSNNDLKYNFDGSDHINMGIMFLDDSGTLATAQAQSILTDNTGNNYRCAEKTAAGYTATLYTAKTNTGNINTQTYPGYSMLDNGQYYTIPSYTFDYTNKNYIAKTTGSNLYCYYDTTTGIVNISFDKTDSSAHFEWDPMILTVTKYGTYNLSYTVNGEDYTGRKISFSESGDYNIVYSYYDPYQYFYSTNSGIYDSSNTPVGPYTHTVRINVTAVEPDIQTYNASFKYVDTWANSAKQVIGTDNKTYVMPDVSGTSSTIGSTTAGGKTIYYPIVTVGPTSSNGNTSYSSGKGYYFAPVFNALNITDYNQDTGASQYTYNKSCTTWPHGKSSTTGPDTTVFGYAYAEKTWNNYCPYARSTNSQYYKYGKNNNGLCYTTEEIEANNSACTHLVQYHYVSNDGTTYYYYIQYSFSAMTYSSCFTPDALITLADGTQKPIEEITYNDRIMSYNFFTGETEKKNIALLVNHGENEYDVLNLEFQDGTILRTIGDHGVFDYTLNKYVYLTKDNFNNYIGHKFVKFKENGRIKKVKLTDAFVTEEFTTAYSITSAQNANAIAQNMLTVAPPDKFYNWIDMSGKMRYDKKQFDADVEKYGLYDYSVFEDYVSYEEYVAFNGPYLKVAVEKGKFTFDDIIHLIDLYGSFMK